MVKVDIGRKVNPTSRTGVRNRSLLEHTPINQEEDLLTPPSGNPSGVYKFDR